MVARASALVRGVHFQADLQWLMLFSICPGASWRHGGGSIVCIVVASKALAPVVGVVLASMQTVHHGDVAVDVIPFFFGLARRHGIQAELWLISQGSLQSGLFIAVWLHPRVRDGEA